MHQRVIGACVFFMCYAWVCRCVYVCVCVCVHSVSVKCLFVTLLQVTNNNIQISFAHVFRAPPGARAYANLFLACVLARAE